jgi:hypothetical protein
MRGITGAFMEINPFASFATEKPDIFPLPEGDKGTAHARAFFICRKRERMLYLRDRARGNSRFTRGEATKIIREPAICSLRASRRPRAR